MAWGSLILAAAWTPKEWPRWVAAAIGVLVIGMTVLFVRNLFGVLFGALFGIGLIGAARYLPIEGARGLLTALGLTSCLYAILDIKSDILDRPEALSDARMLAQLTGVHTLIWGVLWIVIALAVGAWLFRFGFRRAGDAPKGGGEILEA